MASICNGITAFGGLIPYCGTFLNFIGYAMGAVRVSALSHFRVVFVGTHDSIGLGEDGPTHQPVEMLESLRTTPNMWVRHSFIHSFIRSFIYWFKRPTCACGSAIEQHRFLHCCL